MSTLLQELETLAPLAAAATDGPWTWDFRPESHTISLMSGWNTVLDTKRWGSQGATIRMRDPENPSCLLPLHVDAVPHEGRAHHNNWALTINPARTDATFIAAARNFLTPARIAELQTLAAAPAAVGGGGATGKAAAEERISKLFDKDGALLLPSNIKDLPDMPEDERADMMHKAVGAAGHCLLMAFFACKVPNFINGGFADGAGNEYELTFRRKPAAPVAPAADAAR